MYIINVENLTWLGHAGFKIIDEANGNKVYYIDPFELPSGVKLEKADLIFVTHAHPDHFSPEDIKKILKPETIVVGSSNFISSLEVPDSQKFHVTPNQEYELGGTKFETVPQYNVNPEKLQFHPKENGWTGYIVEVNSKKIYQAGDTDFIPEMKDFPSKNIDIALLPIGGHYTMEVDEAIEAANAIKAKVTIPMHYKRLLGDKHAEAAEKFKKGVTNSEVIILEEVS